MLHTWVTHPKASFWLMGDASPSTSSTRTPTSRRPPTRTPSSACTTQRPPP
jgi:hypothetical protein